ncbi:UNVERIFIED_CONTAM: Retrovirus-related Pol polyprotein from transposon TNT 1-94 [Sesamum indicum]
MGLGDVSSNFKEGYRLTLKNVRYVPDLSHNLISCAALEEDGLEGRWGKGLMKIMKGSLIVFKAEKKWNLYLCSVAYDAITASVNECDMTALWHKRLGHMSLKGLEFLKKEGIFNDKIEKLNFCDDCVMGKHHKVHFPASSPSHPSMSSCILDYVHTDVWGPSSVPTHVFEKFEKWKVFVENKTGKRLKSLRTDNGLEFCNKDFSRLCEKFVFLGEAILTAAHLINLSLSVPLSGKTPDFMWTGRKSDISSLRVFGCSAFVHQNLDKLEPRSIKCVFIGYPEGIKGYRLWVRSQRGFKVLISRDVTFNENELPCLDKTQHREKEPTFTKVEEHLEDNQEGEENNENLVEQTAENENLEQTTENDAIITGNSLNDYQLARDRVRRETRIPPRLRDYHTALNAKLSERTNVEEAIKSDK